MAGSDSSVAHFEATRPSAKARGWAPIPIEFRLGAIRPDSDSLNMMSEWHDQYATLAETISPDDGLSENTTPG